MKLNARDKKIWNKAWFAGYKHCALVAGRAMQDAVKMTAAIEAAMDGMQAAWMPPDDVEVDGEKARGTQ